MVNLSHGFCFSVESCIMIWDVEHKQSLKFQHYETCSSLSWFPGSVTTVVSGSSMGWVKVFDTRSNSQAPVISWLAHPANRPRKVKGLRPDFVHDSNILATFSDAYGDFVKVWDLRQIPMKNSSKKTGVLQAYGINPYFAGHDISNASGVINDCAWSTIRSGVLAVATSSQKCVSFFRFKEDQLQDNGVSSVTSSPLYTISTPDQVRSLSWQADDQMRVWSSGSATDGSALLLNDAGSSDISAEQINKYESVEFGEKLRSEIIKHETSSSLLSLQPRAEVSSKRLLGAVQGGVFDMEVRDDNPFAYGNGHLAVLFSGGKIAVANISIDEFKIPDVTDKNTLSLSEKLLYCFKDLNQLMKDRAKSGYSLDATTNTDILSEELDCLHKSMIENADSSMNMANMALSNSIFEVYRVWAWLDRLETNSSDSKVSIQKAGVLQVLNIQDVSKVTEIKGKLDESFVNFHPETGAPTYYSKNRAAIRKLCGWVNSLVLEGSNNNSTNSLTAAASFTSTKSKPLSSWGDLNSRSDSGGGSLRDENDLLVHIVENYMQYSFERAAIVALWHGDLNYAVRILHGAVESHNKAKLSSFGTAANNTQSVDANTNQQTREKRPAYDDDGDDGDDEDMFNVGDEETNSDGKVSSVEWDYPVSDNYMQVVALVGMCLAGYYPSQSEANSTRSTSFMRDRQAWKTMCEHVLYQLRAFERTAASYLSAGCLFLLANCNETTMNQNSLQRYSNILDDPNLVLEDRISFAANYLDDEDLISWLLQLKQNCLKKGSLEGLILTGLSHQGCEILQGFIDRTNDIQTTALICSRVIHSNESNSSKEDEQIHHRVTIWLHSYRTLLTKWNLNIERAHLDIEIGQRVQKNKHSKIPKNTISVSGKMTSSAGGSGGSGSSSTTTSASGNNSKMVKGGTTTTQQRIPIYEGALARTSKFMQYSFVKLKCSFCNIFLPMDDMPSTRTDALRSGKSILNCCGNCGKQLPRCYVCQLHMVRNKVLLYILWRRFVVLFYFLLCREWLIRICKFNASQRI